MKPFLATLIVSLGLLAPAVRAQPVADHLECYRVRDPQARTTYTADLGGLVAAPGCLIKMPAKIVCVPATKTNVTPAPPGGSGPPVPNNFACYKIKCPKATLHPFALEDQFGPRTVTPLASQLLCAPTAPALTTTTSTTSTTLPPCTVAGARCGTCTNGLCFPHCGTAGTPLVCVNAIGGEDLGCTGDSQCFAPGFECVGIFQPDCANAGATVCLGPCP